MTMETTEKGEKQGSVPIRSSNFRGEGQTLQQSDDNMAKDKYGASIVDEQLQQPRSTDEMETG